MRSKPNLNRGLDIEQVAFEVVIPTTTDSSATEVSVPMGIAYEPTDVSTTMIEDVFDLTTVELIN